MVDLNLMAQQIKTILANVPGIQEAFDYEPETIHNLPAVTLFFDGFSQTQATTRRTEVGWQWSVRIYIPIDTSDIEGPQRILRTLLQDTLKQLRDNLTLNGSCLYHTVSAGDVVALLEQTNPLMVAELTLLATTEEY